MGRPDATKLAKRLRMLRQGQWPAHKLTQQDVAQALGVAVSSVSSWESVSSGKLPPEFRLADYARFFATPRSVDGATPRLLADHELTEAEQAERDRLRTELDRLRLAAGGDEEPADDRSRSLWHFPDGGPVRIICGQLPEPSRYIKARDHNYLQLAAYADLDALVELFGHVRAANPTASVGFELAARLESDDVRSHLVLLGSEHTNRTTRLTMDMLRYPVRQVRDPGIDDGEVFELADTDGPRRFAPRFTPDDMGDELVSDVGMFFRTRNHANVDRTLTICSGVFTRGVYGAVRMLTDADMRDANEQHLAGIFGGADTFGLLFQVPVMDHATATPDLRNAGTILHSWTA